MSSENKIEPSLVEGEARVRDLDLAKRLGFGQPADIRKLIARHAETLNKISVLATVAKTPDRAGGRPTQEYWLTKKQAIFITTKSETAIATEVTLEIIERFDAYEQGLRVAGEPKPGTLAAFMALPLDERRERRLMIETTEEVIGPVSAHGMFEATVCKVSELRAAPHLAKALFDGQGVLAEIGQPKTAAVTIMVNSPAANGQGGAH